MMRVNCGPSMSIVTKAILKTLSTKYVHIIYSEASLARHKKVDKVTKYN